MNFLGTTDGQPLRIQAPRVGINTTNPAGTLDVNTGAGSVIFRSEGAAPALVVSNSPNEGVLRFRHRLEVWPNPSATEFGTLDVRDTNGAVTVRLPGRGDGYFVAGNFGLGTTTPQEKLHVAGRFLRVDGLGNEPCVSHDYFNFMLSHVDFIQKFESGNNSERTSIIHSVLLVFA